ncbi:MAG: N-acetylmuramoyl-L-alanine amidase [Proteobacteria bacterium]|nr:N-acetylmuramoyl-L-alanine amidase [Pseudomonadota bacterium]
MPNTSQHPPDRGDTALPLRRAPGCTSRTGALCLVTLCLLDTGFKPARAEPRQRLIVLDPGHGGTDSGALSTDGSLSEARLVLDIAKRVRRILLRRDPGLLVLMTREHDIAVSLEERIALANAWNADVFLSLHLNAASSSVRKGGVVTFVLDRRDGQDIEEDRVRQGPSHGGDPRGLQRVLSSLQRGDLAERSKQLARSVQRLTVATGRRGLPSLADRGVRRRLFSVLLGARMPAALLEAAFLTEPREAAALRTERYRELLAGGIAEGILSYLQAVS